MHTPNESSNSGNGDTQLLLLMLMLQWAVVLSVEGKATLPSNSPCFRRILINGSLIFLSFSRQVKVQVPFPSLTDYIAAVWEHCRIE